MKRKMSESSSTEPESDVSSTSSVGEAGLYFYGITLHRHLADSSIAFIRGIANEPVKVVSCRELAAIVSQVMLAEFEATTIRANLQDAQYLESLVRSHEGVVRAMQLERTILPTRLGLVYASEEELVAKLEPAHDSLVSQLAKLEGCDEWGIKLHADRSIVRQRVTEDNSKLKELWQQWSSATPGRAYLLERKLAQAIEAATEQALSDSAQLSYDRLAGHAISAQQSNASKASPALGNEVEVLQAAFLVPRKQLHAFLNEVHRLPESEKGLRCEYNGPWAPYSFTTLGGGKLHG